jgi:hypothetical protein
MKKSELRQLIKEEINSILKEKKVDHLFNWNMTYGHGDPTVGGSFTVGDEEEEEALKEAIKYYEKYLKDRYDIKFKKDSYGYGGKIINLIDVSFKRKPQPNEIKKNDPILKPYIKDIKGIITGWGDEDNKIDYIIKNNNILKIYPTFGFDPDASVNFDPTDYNYKIDIIQKGDDEYLKIII